MTKRKASQAAPKAKAAAAPKAASKAAASKAASKAAASKAPKTAASKVSKTAASNAVAPKVASKASKTATSKDPKTATPKAPKVAKAAKPTKAARTTKKSKNEQPMTELDHFHKMMAALNDDIHYLVACDKIEEVLQRLAKKPSLIHTKDRDGGSLLHSATRSEELVAYILAKSPSMINAIDSSETTPLHCAAQSGQDKIVARMLAVASQTVIDARSMMGETALFMAAREGHDKVVALLLPRTSPVLLRHDAGFESRTVLHIAAENGHDKIVAQILAAYPDLLDLMSKKRNSPLHLAAEKGHDKVLALLLAANPASAAWRDHFGWSTLHYAYSPKIVTQLLAVCPKLIDAVHGDGNVVHSAAENGRESAALKLLEIKPELATAVDGYGDTPFYTAVSYVCCSDPPPEKEQFSPFLENLLKFHPDAVRITNDNGKTPYDNALYYGCTPLIEYLQYKMSFDEIVAAEKRQNRVEPVLEEQCEDLWTLLGRDMAGIVFEYLLGHNPRQQQQESPLKRAKLDFPPIILDPSAYSRFYWP